MTTASAMLTAPMILPSRLLGRDAPSNHVRLAAIGCGQRGRENIGHGFIDQLPDARVVAACDPFREKRETFASLLNAKYGAKVCEPVADYREVLARSDIDAIVVSTQDHWHVPIAYAAALAGKDMYVEKPLSIAFAWSQKLRKVVNEKKVVFQYGTQQRGSQPQFRRACELVRNGYIGEVREVLAWCPDMSSQFALASVPPYGSTEPIAPPEGFDYDMWIGPAPMKPYTADRCTAYGGFHIYDYALGFIAGWGAHPIDIVHWGLNMDASGPTKCEAAGIIPPNGSLWDTIESWDLRCEYPGGIRMRLMGGRISERVVKSRLGTAREEDNGSTDDTTAVARAAGAAVVSEPQRGYGAAAWRGTRDLPAEIEWIIFSSADGSDRIDDVAAQGFQAAALAGADLILGERVTRAASRRWLSPPQRFGNALCCWLIALGWGRRFHDMASLRAIRREVFEALALEDRAFGWNVEMQVRALEQRRQIAEVPVPFFPRTGGESKISGNLRGIIRAGWGILTMVGWQYFRRWRSAPPKARPAAWVQAAKKI